MAVLQGVIVTATGDLVRAGYVDFASLPDFDGGVESVRTDLPASFYVKGAFNGIFDSGDPDYNKFHRWNGATWITVLNTLSGVSAAAFSETKSLNFKQLMYTGLQLTTIEYYSDALLTDNLYTQVLSYNPSLQLETVVMTRHSDGQVFTKTLTWAGLQVTNVDYS